MSILTAPDYPSTAAVRIQLDRYAIPNEHFDPVQTHLASEVRENDLTSAELYAEQGIRERFFNDSFHYLCIRHHICACDNISLVLRRQ